MANRYWVGGTGTWTTTTTNWSDTSGGAGGFSAPTAADSVFFDQAGTYTVTMTGALTCLDITVSAGTVTFATGTTPTLAVSGSMSLIAGTVWSSTGATTFNSATTGRTITTNGTVLSGAITFSNAAGGWSLGSAVRSSTTTTLTAGSLSLNGFDLTTGVFATAGALVRSVNFGTNNIILNAASGTVLSMAVLGGFTYTGTGGFTADASVVRTYSVGTTSGGTATNAPNLTFTGSGTAIPVLTTAGWFKNLNFGSTNFTLAATTLNLQGLTLGAGVYTNLSAIFGGTGTITPNAKSIAALTIASAVTTLAGALSCTTYAQSAGTFDLATFNLTCSGAVSYAGATSLLSNIGTITCTTFTVTTGGTLTLTSGTITPSTSFAVAGTGVFNYNGGTLSAVPTFTHTAGTVSFGKAYALTATGTYTLTAGSLTLNGFDLTTGIFSSSNINTRSINFGTNNILLTHTTAAQTVLAMADVTGLTTTSTTGGFVSNASVTRTFTFGTSSSTAAAIAPNLAITSGAAVTTFTNGSWFKTLDFTGSTTVPAMTATTLGIYVDTLTLATGGTYTGLVPVLTRTQTWAPQFSKQLGGIGFNLAGGTLTLDNTQTYTATSQFLLVQGTLSLASNLTFGVFNSNNANTRSIAFSTYNIELATTTAASTNLNINNANGFTYTGTGGFTLAANITRTITVANTGGTSTNAPNITFTGSGTAIATITTGWYGKIDFGTTAFAVPTATVNVNSIVLSTGGTFTSLSVVTVGTGTITSNGKPIAGLQINNTGGGTTTLVGAVTYATTSASTTLSSGTLDLNGNDLTTGVFNGSGTTARSIIFGTNNIILVHPTAASTVLNVTNATNFSYTGSGGFTAAANVTRTYLFGTTGGSTTNAPNLTLTGSGTAVQTFTTLSWFNKLDFGTTAFNPGTTTLNLNSLTLSTGGTFTGLTAQMTGTGSITSNNKQLAALTITSAGVTTLNDALATIATGTTTLTSGTLTLNGFNLTTGIFSSTGVGVRSIVFGTSNILITHTTAAQTVLAMADATNFTWSGTTGGFRSDASVTRTFTFGTTGGSLSNAPNLAITSGAAVTTFTNGSWFDILDFTGSANTTAMTASTIGIYVDTLTLATGGTYTSLIPVFTRTQTWTSQFSKQLGGIGVGVEGVTLTLDNTQTYTATSSCILTKGTLDLGGANQTFGLISSTGTGVRSIIFGSNNIILAHTTAATVAMSMADVTNFTYTGTGGFSAAADVARTYTFGTTGGSITNSPNLTFTGTGTAVQTLTNLSWFNVVDFGTTVFNPGTTTLNLDGLTLSASGTFTGLTAYMRGTGTITGNGNATLLALTIDNVSGTTTLGSNFSLWTAGNSTTTLTTGALALADYTLTAGRFISSNTNARSISFGSGNILLSYFTAGTNLSMADATNFTWTGTGGFTANMSAATITRRFQFGTTAGGSDANSPNLSIIAGGVEVNIDTGGWFNKLDCTGSTSTISGSATASTTTLNLKNLTLGSGTYTNLIANITASGSISGNSKSISTLAIAHTGTTTLTSALTVVGTTTLGLGTPTLDLGGYDLTTGTFTSSNTNVRTVIFGTNFIVTTNGGVSMADATNFTYTGTGGFKVNAATAQTISYGSTSGASASNAINLFVYTGAGTTSITAGSWFKTLNCTGSTGIVGTTSTTARSYYIDNLILPSGAVVASAYTSLIANMYGAGTINGNGKSINTITIVDGNTATLQSALTLTALYTQVTNTTLDLAGFTLTTSAGFNYTNGTLTMNSGIISATTYTHNGPTFTLSNGAINCSTSFVLNSGSFTLGSGASLGATPTFTHTAGDFILGKSYALTTDGAYNFTTGTIDLAGFTLSTGSFVSSNTNTRSISFGSGNIALTTSSAGNYGLAMSSADGFTYTGTGGFTSNMNVSRAFRFGYSSGGSAANAPNLSLTGGASEALIGSGSYFKTFDCTGCTSTISGATTGTTTILYLRSMTLGTGGNYIGVTAIMNAGTGTINGNGKTISSLQIDHSETTTLATTTGSITVSGTTIFGATSTPTLDLNGQTLTTGSFNSSYTTVRSIIFGSSYIYLSSTSTVLNMSIADNFTYTGTGGFRTINAGSQTFSFGNTSGATESNAPRLLLSAGAGGFDFSDNSWFSVLDFTGNTGTSSTANIKVNNLILSSGGTYLALTVNMYGTSSTVNGNSKSLATFTINPLGTTTLQSALGVTTYTQIADTTLDLAGYTFTSSGIIDYNGGTINNFGPVSCTIFTVNGVNFTLNGGSIACSTRFTINSGSFTFGPLATSFTSVDILQTAGDITFSKAATITGTYTHTAGVLTLNGIDLTVGVFNSSGTGVRSVVFGSGNIGNIILVTTASAVNNVSMGDMTNFSCSGAGGFKATANIIRQFRIGSTSGGSINNAPNLAITGGAFEVQIYTGSWFKTLDFTGSTSTISGSTTASITSVNTQSLTLATGGSYTGLTAIILDTGTINGNGKSIQILTINHAGTTTFAGALGCVTYNQTAGDVDFGSYNLTATGNANYTAGTLTNIGTISCASWLVTGNFSLTNGTITPSTSFVVTSGSFTYSGGTLSAVSTFTQTLGTVTFSKAYALTTTGAYTFTAGNLILNGYHLTTGRFSSDNTNTRSINFGINDIILTHTTATTVALNMGTTTGFTVSGTGGFRADADVARTYTFGVVGGSYDIAPNLTFTGSGTAVPSLATTSYFNKLDFGTTAFNPSTVTLNLNSLTLSTSGTYTTLTANMVGTGIVNTNGKTILVLVINTPGTVTLGSNVTCTNYTQTTGTIDYAGYTINASNAVAVTQGIISNINLTCASFTLSTGTLFIESGTINTPTFTVTSGTLNYNGGNLSSVTSFTHTAGTVNLGTNLTLANTSTYTFTAGTLNIAGYTLTTGIFSSSNSNIRSITFGTGNISLAHTTVAQTVLSMATVSNFSYTGSGGFTAAANVTRTYLFGTGGGDFFNAPNLYITSGAEIPTITNNSWFKILDFTGSTCTPAASTFNVDTLTLASGGTYTNIVPQFTRTQTWTSQYGKTLGGIGFNRLYNTLTLDGTQTYSATSICSLVSGTINLGGYDLTVGVFNSSNTNIRSVVFGNNNIILATTTASSTVLSISNATNFSYSSITGGFISDAVISRTFEFGTTAGSIFNAPNLLINAGTLTPSITGGSWFNKLDFTGSSCVPFGATLNVNSLTLSSGGTFTGLSFNMRANGTITTNGKTIGALVINHSEVGTTTLTGAVTCLSQTYLSGNVDFANFNLTSTGAAAYTSGTFSNLNTLTCTTFTVTGNFTLTQGTVTPTSSFTINSGSFTYDGGTLSPVPTFAHTAGTVTLNKSYAMSAGSTYTLTTGVLNLNTYNLTAGIFSSTGATVRSINFGTGNIILNHNVAAATVLAMADVTNFTESGTGGFVSDASLTRTYAFGTTSGGSTTNAPNLSIISGSAVQTLGKSWFNTVDFTGSACSVTSSIDGIYVSTVILSTNGTYTSLVPVFTRSQTWSMQYGKQLYGIGTREQATLTLDGTQTFPTDSLVRFFDGTLNLGGYDLTIGQFLSNVGTGTRVIQFGSNNIVLTATAGSNKIDIPNATNFTCTGTGGFTAAANVTANFTFGTTGGGSSTTSPNLTFTGSGTAIQTLTTGSWFNKLDFGTTAFNPGITALNLNSLTFSASGTYSSMALTMVGTGTIISNGNTTLDGLTALTINHNGTTSLGDNLATTITGPNVLTTSVILTSGTLNLNGYNLTVGRFSSSGTGVRSILFGTNTITIKGSGGALSMADATNFTYTGTGGFVGDMSTVAKSFNFGSTGTSGSVNNAPNLSITTGAFAPTLTDGSWFKNLDFTGSTCTPIGGVTTGIYVDTLTLATGGTYTGLTPIFTRTQTWTSQFSKQLGGIGLNIAGGTLTLDNTQTYTATSFCNLVAGTLNLNDYDLTIGTFSSSNSNTRSIIFGTNNIILATTTAATVNLSMPIATGFTYTGTGGFTAAADITRTFSFGNSGVSGTATNSPKLTFTGSGTAVQTLTTNSWFNVLNFGTTAFDPGVTTLNVNSLTLSSGGTYLSLTANMRGTGTITSNGKLILSLIVNHTNSTNTTTLADNLSISSTGSTTLTSGTLNLAGYTLTAVIFNSSNTNTRSISFGTGTIALNGAPTGTTVLSMATATNFTYTGTGGFTSDMPVSKTFTFGSTIGGKSSNAPNLSLTSGASIPTFTTGSWFNILDFTGTTSTVATATILYVNSIILATGGTYTSLSLIMVGNGTITTNGKTISSLTINSNNGTGLTAYKVFEWNSSGSITFSSSNAPPTIEYLVVAGGGGGGGNGGGGGGAGGFLEGSTSTLPGQTSVIVVGAGGIGSTSGADVGTSGQNSSIDGIVAIGGGYGASRDAGGAAASGGSGGGGGGALSANSTANAGASGTAGQGFAGGNSSNTGSDLGTNSAGGGGGGAGTAGVSASSALGGNGGAGKISSITGTQTYYAGGGGGGKTINGSGGTGGLGGGASWNDASGSATSNLGGGGRGGSGNPTIQPGNGGSGVVIIRYLASYADPLSTTGSPNVYTASVTSTTSSSDIVTLNGALTTTARATLTLGTLNLNNFTLTTDNFLSNNTNTRAIQFGTGNIAITQTASGTALGMQDMTNFTWTGTGGFTAIDRATSQFYYAGSTAGGSASNAVNLSISGTGGTGPGLINYGWFKNVNFNNINSTLTAGSTGAIYVDTLTLSSAGTFTGLAPVFTRTQTWTAQFSKQLGGIGVNGEGVTLTLDNTQTYSATSVCYLTKGTLNLGGYDLTLGSFSSNNSNTRSIIFGTNNIILSTTTSGATNLNMASTVGFTYTGTGGFTAAADRTRIFSVGTVGTPAGGQIFATAGTYSWTAPEGVTSVNVVSIGGGASGAGNSGGGGGLGWKNNITVVPGQSYTVVVGASGTPGALSPNEYGNNSYFIDINTVAGYGGGRGGPGSSSSGWAPWGGGYVGDGGGRGGNGNGTSGAGGGGAGGYSGQGGDANTLTPASGGGGGHGGQQTSGGTGIYGGSGGGTALNGQGTSGAAGQPNSGSSWGGTGGVGSADIVVGSVGYGGGGGGGYGSSQGLVGGGGAVRIIWGPDRAFPSTNVSTAYEVAASGTSGSVSPANSPNLSFTGSGTAVQTIVSGSTINNLNYGTTAFIVPVSTLYVGTLTLSSGGTFLNLIPVFTKTQTWTPQYSKSLGGIGINNTGSTLTISGTQTFYGNAQLVVDNGTIDLGGNEITVATFVSTGTGSRVITNGTINILGNWDVSYGVGFNASGITINMISGITKTFAGAGGTYGTLVQKSKSQLLITGSNTFDNVLVSNDMVDAPSGEIVFTTPGTYSWPVPSGITSISAVTVGGGGGGFSSASGQSGGGGAGGGGLSYGNLIAVTPGETLTVTVGAGGAVNAATSGTGNAGGATTISRGATVLLSGGGGGGGITLAVGNAGASGGTSTGTAKTGGGAGGDGGTVTGDTTPGGGGGGAGGYTAAGGKGGNDGVAGSSSTGAGGGGGGSGAGGTSQLNGAGGGGVGIGGIGPNGIGGAVGIGGSGGSYGVDGAIDGNTGGTGGLYGGGAGGQGDSSGSANANGGDGAVRIIWGFGRIYPTFSTATYQFTIDYLVVAGGGSGGGSYSGGGGAGGYQSLSTTATLIQPVTYAILVGAGGASGTASSGSDSSFEYIDTWNNVSTTSIGGGGGGMLSSDGLAGGSGGGGGRSGTGGAGISGQGNNGGTSTLSAAAGGGGGAGGTGGIPSGEGVQTAGNGGAGLQWLDANWYAGGGGGGAGGSYGNGGDGGIGGGGAGQGNGTDGTAGAPATNANGAPNTGGGGGGRAPGTSPSNQGGSGVVILRYLTDSVPEPTVLSGNYTVTINGLYSYYKFTSSGSIRFGSST